MADDDAWHGLAPPRRVSRTGAALTSSRGAAVNGPRPSPLPPLRHSLTTHIRGGVGVSPSVQRICVCVAGAIVVHLSPGHDEASVLSEAATLTWRRTRVALILTWLPVPRRNCVVLLFRIFFVAIKGGALRGVACVCGVWCKSLLAACLDLWLLTGVRGV